MARGVGIPRAFLGRTLRPGGRGRGRHRQDDVLAGGMRARSSQRILRAVGARGGRRSGVGLCRTGGPARRHRTRRLGQLARSTTARTRPTHVAVHRRRLRGRSAHGRGGIPRGDRGTRPASEGDTGRRRSAVAGSVERVGHRLRDSADLRTGRRVGHRPHWSSREPGRVAGVAQAGCGTADQPAADETRGPASRRVPAPRPVNLPPRNGPDP